MDIYVLIKIETYWNVNDNNVCGWVTGIVIKIETYWNVNDDLERVWVNTPH